MREYGSGPTRQTKAQAHQRLSSEASSQSGKTRIRQHLRTNPIAPLHGDMTGDMQKSAEGIRVAAHSDKGPNMEGWRGA